MSGIELDSGKWRIGKLNLEELIKGHYEVTVIQIRGLQLHI